MLANIVEGKKIILVGPASYLRGSQKGSFIDNFDLVIRLNDSYKIKESDSLDLGKRTDILYHCLWGPIFPSNVALLKQKVKFIKSSYPSIPPFRTDIDKFIRVNQERIKFESYDVKVYKKLENMCESRPNTGTCAIYDLLKMNPKQMHISGITMFRGGYIDGYRKKYMLSSRKEAISLNNKHGNHNIEKQIKVLRNILNNKIITMDDFVKQSVMEDK